MQKTFYTCFVLDITENIHAPATEGFLGYQLPVDADFISSNPTLLIKQFSSQTQLNNWVQLVW